MHNSVESFAGEALTMEFHEAANIFPMDEENLADLAKDIRENGQHVPIEVFEGKILDGRRRYRACLKVGVKPKFRTVVPADPIAYVLSLNLHRRHLTTSQASMCAARAQALWEKLREEAKQRQKEAVVKGNKSRAGKVEPPVRDNCPELEAGRTRDKIGALFGVSGKNVERAKRVIKNAIPEVAKAVDDGLLSAHKAADYISTCDPEIQKEVLDRELSKDRKANKQGCNKDRRYEPGVNGTVAESNGDGSTGGGWSLDTERNRTIAKKNYERLGILFGQSQAIADGVDSINIPAAMSILRASDAEEWIKYSKRTIATLRSLSDLLKQESKRVK